MNVIGINQIYLEDQLIFQQNPSWHYVLPVRQYLDQRFRFTRLVDEILSNVPHETDASLDLVCRVIGTQNLCYSTYFTSYDNESQMNDNKSP